MKAFTLLFCTIGPGLINIIFDSDYGVTSWSVGGPFGGPGQGVHLLHGAPSVPL